MKVEINTYKESDDNIFYVIRAPDLGISVNSDFEGLYYSTHVIAYLAAVARIEAEIKQKKIRR